jgi:hypothetical protein
MNNDEIEKLKKRLYKKGEVFKERKFRSPLFQRKTEAKTYWESPSDEEGHLVLPEKQKFNFRRKLIIALFVVVALAIFGAAIYFLIVGGVNVVSSRNIEISLEGPSSIKGGESGNWQVVITNKNKTNLELADLIIEYPDGSKPISDSFGRTFSGTKNLFERRSIGMIKAGETKTQQIRVYLFGEKDTDKTFKLTLEYRPEGSNAILAATKEQIVRLLQSPMEISLNIPKETNAGEEITLEANIISNSQTLIKDVNFKMEYPAGFRYLDSDLKPTAGDNVWRLGDLESNMKRAIKIRGVLYGQDLMEFAFRASAGPLDENGEVVAYGFAVQSIILKKPFLKLGAEINGETEEVIVPVGADLNVSIDWQNTLPTKITNAVIEVKIIGSAADQRAISVNKGFYRSFDQTLVWNQSSSPDLSVIEPLEQGRAKFKFSILDSLPNDIIRQGNPAISLDITMRAERITEEQGKVEITNHLTKEIKIATSFQLSRRALYYSGPFKNSGPLPPKVGRETTYTVIWSLTNSSNNVSNAMINAFLPSYVRWLGKVQPEDSDVSYNQTTGEIIWRAGAVPIGAGILSAARELAFQISFLPNAAQIGSQPTLVSEVTLSGKDDFTGAFLRDVKYALTTYLDSDPQFKYNEAAVTQ